MELNELEALWNSNADRYNQWNELGLDEIVAYAQEVEREECAKACEEVGRECHGDGRDDSEAFDCADRIRARSNAGNERAPLAGRPLDEPVGWLRPERNRNGDEHELLPT